MTFIRLGELIIVTVTVTCQLITVTGRRSETISVRGISTIIPVNVITVTSLGTFICKTPYACSCDSGYIFFDCEASVSGCKTPKKDPQSRMHC
jgi:hypothetical protein